MRTTQIALTVLLAAPAAFACTVIAPKNPIKASAVCGKAIDPTGATISDLDLRMLDEKQNVVAEVHTDANGDFRFPAVPKGRYVMTSYGQGWQLGAAVQVTKSGAYSTCSHPLLVQPGLICGGGISKKGYHPKY